MWQHYVLPLLFCLFCVSAQIVIGRYVAVLRDENARMRHLLNTKFDELTKEQTRELLDLIRQSPTNQNDNESQSN
ncbi:hypothetical protein ACAW74_18305 [Fibrella sp. WM1]|uniref:hypothetical protein n=1 Tax=Fibrella musci TaxID=3242485 RepID=UPI003522FA47